MPLDELPEEEFPEDELLEDELLLEEELLLDEELLEELLEVERPDEELLPTDQRSVVAAGPTLSAAGSVSAGWAGSPSTRPT